MGRAITITIDVLLSIVNPCVYICAISNQSHISNQDLRQSCSL